MADASYSSDLPQTSHDDKLSEAIQNLPPELREMIYKAYVATKLREREALGWTKVHEEMAVLRKIWERSAFGWDELDEEIVACIGAVDPSCDYCHCAVGACREWICKKCQSYGCPGGECPCADCTCGGCICDECPCGECPCGTCAECPCGECTCGERVCRNKKERKERKLVGMRYQSRSSEVDFNLCVDRCARQRTARYFVRLLSLRCV